MLPLFQLRRKLTLFSFSGKLCLALSFSQISCSHAQFSHINEKGVLVIATQKAYNRTIQNNDNKRLVSVRAYVQPFIAEWKYASEDNFTHKVLYTNPEAYIRLEAALALRKVQSDLSKIGVGLKFYDAYRPYSVTLKMWKVVPDERYTANPSKGSGHNRGAAVDVTLISLQTKEELQMPTAFDDFTDKAHHNYPDLPTEVKANRNLLKTTMEKHGFVALSTEWWHYSLPNSATRFELLDFDFPQMSRIVRQ